MEDRAFTQHRKGQSVWPQGRCPATPGSCHIDLLPMGAAAHTGAPFVVHDYMAYATVESVTRKSPRTPTCPWSCIGSPHPLLLQAGALWVPSFRRRICTLEDKSPDMHTTVSSTGVQHRLAASGQQPVLNALLAADCLDVGPTRLPLSFLPPHLCP